MPLWCRALYTAAMAVTCVYIKLLYDSYVYSSLAVTGNCKTHVCFNNTLYTVYNIIVKK